MSSSELQRFLSRFPDLNSSSPLEMHNLFLNPKYTVVIAGCFRGTNLKSIVDRVVVEGGGGGCSLVVHESVCLALSRALHLAPFLLSSVLDYFKFAPCPFQRVLRIHLASHIASEDEIANFSTAIKVSYRFLLLESQVFSTKWDWSCFLDLAQQLDIIFSGEGFIPSIDMLDMRWCVAQVLAIILKLSEKSTNNYFRLGADKAFKCLLRWEEYCQDASVEKAGWYINANPYEICSEGINKFSEEHCLQSLDAMSITESSTHSSERKRRKMSRDENLDKRHFLVTPTVKRSYDMLMLAVDQKLPVLLFGPQGSGKTAMLQEVAELSGNEVLFIHMDEQMDGKTLIGSYVCTEQPGEFKWQHGSLIQSVRSGKWIVFENIDKSPADVQSILLPLLEGASSYVTGRGEEIRVDERFRLFATISSSQTDISRNLEGMISLSNLWQLVMISPHSKEDLLKILEQWYPDLKCMDEKLIETFEQVNSPGGSQPSNRFSLRDILKWCKRIMGADTGPTLSVPSFKAIYREAVDIFASSSSSLDGRLLTMKQKIAVVWKVGDLQAHSPIVKDIPSGMLVGRVSLECTEAGPRFPRALFVNICSSLHLLEKIACAVKYNEPVLLVGETGTGKTTIVQNLASRIGQELNVLNLSQQSDVADLLGGLKPVDPQPTCIRLYNEFIELFKNTFSEEDNTALLNYVRKLESDKNWKKLLRAIRKVCSAQKTQAEQHESGKKRKRLLTKALCDAWDLHLEQVETALKQVEASFSMVFSFVEGAFTTALKNGSWILLDEINLAPPETLQRIMGVLEGEKGSLCLAERGDVCVIKRHPNFRIFACMNPATDAGKHDLPYSLRSRFTEYFVDEILDKNELTFFVSGLMDRPSELVDRIVKFYKAAKSDSEEKLQDGANQKAQFSLRSLCRALVYMQKAEKKFGEEQALYDGFCMFFLMLLDSESAKSMKNTILSTLLGGKMPEIKKCSRRQKMFFCDYLEMDVTEVEKRARLDAFTSTYILTPSVEEHLKNLARALLVKIPVLLQGPTSSGKTSLVHYLASVTGNVFVRINNHEHTDLQEYLGSYVTNSDGKIVFQEGVLVKAVRNGHWIVLDELNLAPSDVLEALNRLLDDNRELVVPELRETVKAHPNFMLFATQNPPTFYGGRKILSRAFRNRFVEIHVDDIPEAELKTILVGRCKIPPSYAKKMVEVMQDLQLHRQSSKVFAGKHGFITPRDLFRWGKRFSANRYSEHGCSYKDFAKDGYFLLAERLRDETEKKVVQEVLERRLNVKLDIEKLYTLTCSGHFDKITWTKSMERLYFLVKRCYEDGEPVLLVGETGGGKTTVCQLLSKSESRKLHILNCHLYTETSDFLGGFYPTRDRSKLAEKFGYLVEQMKESNCLMLNISSDIRQSSTMDHLKKVLKDLEDDKCKKMVLELLEIHRKWNAIFMWEDGPLLQAMKAGDLFLVDEISLADDSVLERLNSVLEPEKQLTLAEKGGPTLEKVTAQPQFFLLATMNPGGDYGKKELSPALRNRFTEIWVTPVTERSDLESIIVQRLKHPRLVNPILEFLEWFNSQIRNKCLTLRDLLSWIDFINVTEGSLGSDLSAFIHGAFLVVLDGLSLGNDLSRYDSDKLRINCFEYLLHVLKKHEHLLLRDISNLETYGWSDMQKLEDGNCSIITQEVNSFGIHPFYIQTGNDNCNTENFEFKAPTTCKNALRVLRAMQLGKPILLEGSPGVGKTSLVTSIARFSGHKAVRINLSEQTDIMDLLGSDLPVHDDEGMKFAWSDGILLQALKCGDWVLLDEINLAPQAVLEGLNAILDHRAEVYIPELGETFKCPPSFRVFACQNPSSQGGGRKGLPKSFLNRFTKVYVNELGENDYKIICKSLHPSVPDDLLSKLISFNRRLHENTMVSRKYGQDGAPWEFNLRDVIRSCQIMEGAAVNEANMGSFLNIVYIQRMRTSADRRKVLELYKEVFGEKQLFINLSPRVQISPQHLIVGKSCIERNHYQPSNVSKSELQMLPRIRYSLEAVVNIVKHNWLSILVGPSSSGKTSLVKLLAKLSGNVLHVLNLSQATDISDLLGCFEQYQALRKFHSVKAQVERCMNEYISLISGCSLVSDDKELLSKWLKFQSSLSTSGASIDVDNLKLVLLDEIIQQLKCRLESSNLSVSWSKEDLDEVRNNVSGLLEKSKKVRAPAKFEWVTGLLITAIRCGDWVVLENANLCNPTVLDRINSLVESSGSITVNECGLVDGRPVMYHPHSKFRLFLTVNPRFGEISRAMRNRGVEVFMMDPNWLDEENVGAKTELGDVRRFLSLSGVPTISFVDTMAAFTMDPSWLNERNADYFKAELRDVKRFLALSGVPTRNLVHKMAEAHMIAKGIASVPRLQITLLELSRWVQLFQQLVMKGNNPIWSITISWDHTYLSSLSETEGRDAFDKVKGSFASAFEVSKLGMFGCSLPGGWPSPLKLTDYLCYSREACVKQNCMYLEFLGAQYASFQYGTRVDQISVEKQLHPSLVPQSKLHQFLFPTRSSWPNLKRFSNFDCILADKVLSFAAIWTMEQVTVADLDLYLVWFNWYTAKLEPHCAFFQSFLTFLEEERNHTIWKCTVDDRRQRCVGLLALSFQQWTREVSNEETSICTPIQSLRKLEEEVLDKLASSEDFDTLSQLYSKLLENHILFWNGVISKDMVREVIGWRSAKKNLEDLKKYFSHWVGSEDFSNVCKLRSHSPKPLLWVHGGHPFLPSSDKMYYIMQLLLWVSGFIWPMRADQMKHTPSVIDGLFKELTDKQLLSVNFFDSINALVGSESFMMDTLSANLELRLLAMQGICMSSYFRDDKDDAELCGMLQKLSSMIITENEALLASNIPTSVACCTFTYERLSTEKYYSTWQETLSLFNSTSFFLDVEVLNVLSNNILVDGKVKVLEGLSNISQILESALVYSMKFSSRPPTDFVPHQRILWTLKDWESVDSEAIVVSSVLEMWFKWHSSLWNYCPNNAPLPYMLFQSTTALTIDQILESPCPIKDYDAHCLKLRVVGQHIWHDSASGRDIVGTLFSAARSLFKQIIIAHKETFDEEDFMKIKKALFFVQIKEFKLLSSQIAKSKHSRLASQIDKFVKPLLETLYLHSSDDSLYNLGQAWIHIGGLRFHLLCFHEDDPDPVLKYSIKRSRITEQISALTLDLKVREECEYLAGKSSTEDDLCERTRSLINLETESRKLQKKVVFRPGSDKFTMLKYNCEDFLQVGFAKLTKLVQKLESMDEKQMNDEAINWQETATSFVNQLSSEYDAYVDIVQPIQVAVYEMKFGLSLALSGALQRAFLKKGAQNSKAIEITSRKVCSFVRFPRLQPPNFILSKVENTRLHYLSSYSYWEEDRLELKKLLTDPKDSSVGEMVSAHHHMYVLHHSIFVRIIDSVSHSSVMDKSSFGLLKDICDQFDDLWMKMKVQRKEKEDLESMNNFKFRPRVFKVEDIFEVDISSLGSSFSDESLSLEWRDMMVDDETKAENACEANDDSEFEWGSIQESILRSLVDFHNLAFGSVNLIEIPGAIKVADVDKLECFIKSYELGMVMVKGSEALRFSNQNVKLMPEHLLRLCLDYEKKFGVKAVGFNAYKESNAPEMEKMVPLLMTLEVRLTSLLNEWLDHPNLGKILDVTKMLMAIPLDTPLAKALSGLQFLLSKAKMLEETAPNFSLSGQMQPILALVSLWQKMELESWPSLLDEVEEQYNNNAGKLWFPLYSILRRGQTADNDGDNASTVQSLLEFIQTSSIGEFKRRLQLLLAFHGQIKIGMRLGVYVSSMEDTLKILYNIFGFYIHFLPMVLGHIKAAKSNIMKELKNVVKLSRWDRSDPYLSIEASKKTRQKLRKLIQQFNDVLKQPIKAFIFDASLQGRRVPTVATPAVSNDISTTKTGVDLTLSSEAESKDILQQLITTLTPDASKQGRGVSTAPGPAISNDISTTKTGVDLTLFSETERLSRIDEWQKKLDSFLLCIRTSGSDLKSLIPNSVCFFYGEEWNNMWYSLERICTDASGCAFLWNDDSKSYGKRRALSSFLKLLKECGPSSKDDKIGSKWQLEPSYDVQHLLLLKDEKTGSNWKISNEFYYKSIFVVEQLREICLNFHKDFTMEQVNQSSKFFDFLITIQQKQRFLAYGFAEDLKSLRKCTTSLNHVTTKFLNDDCEIAHCQTALYTCMWQQKGIYDSLYAYSHETFLLLQRVQDSHLDVCDSVRADANRILLFIEKFIPKILKSKETLNHYLLGSNGIIITPPPETCLTPLVVSKQMEKLVMQNFGEMKAFEEDIKYLLQSSGKKSIKETILEHLRSILGKGNTVMVDFNSNRKSRKPSTDVSDDEDTFQAYANLKDEFTNVLKKIISALDQLSGSSSDHSLSKSSLSGIITLWKTQVEPFQLRSVCEDVTRTIISAVALIDHVGDRSPNLCSEVLTDLSKLSVNVDMLLTVGDGFLSELVTMHRTVAEMTHMLACMFASLYKNGFGGSTLEEVDESKEDLSTSGTGVGDGKGKKDVSEEITDVNELQKSNEGPEDKDEEVPSNNDKGIEMEQDIDAAAVSVSEDSDNDDSNNDDGDEDTVDSAIGDAGENKEVVDEKLEEKDGDEDSKHNNSNEKYESGPSVKDVDSLSKELRAKDDESGADDGDEKQKNGDTNQEEPHDDDEIMNDRSDLEEDLEDKTMNKDSSYDDPTGIELDEQEREPDTNEPDEDSTTTDEPDLEDHPMKNGNSDVDETDLEDEKMPNGDSDDQVTGNIEENESVEKKEPEEDAEKRSVETSKSLFQSGKFNINGDPAPGSDSATKPNGDVEALGESKSSSRDNMKIGSTSLGGLPNNDDMMMELPMNDSSEHGQLTSAQLMANGCADTPAQRAKPNPLRSVGDAREKWLNVKVGRDIEELNVGPTDMEEDVDAEEYGFVSEPEKGTSQARGPAASDQIDQNIEGNNPDDGEEVRAEDFSDMEEDKLDFESNPLKTSTTILEKNVENKTHVNKGVPLEQPPEGEGDEVDLMDDDLSAREYSEDLVSVEKALPTQELLPFAINDEDLGKATNHFEEMPSFDCCNASELWRRYESKTARLSYELSEQLRLIMEPTLANKLQGDYKTGKRINMKMVIPYIASDYRKDKIWLRRNKPNKRDYQVVVAVDDSRSMSESNCGKIAIEALVTVCRAMSQLEVGQLAVTRFGTKGNIKLLHDFHESFTGEAGIKLISSLKFEQDNKYADTPVADLLKYLRDMLDLAVTNARLSSGQNPLEQLVLVISDGIILEGKDRLKPYIRDLLNKNRLVAFIVVDSSKDSIMDRKAAIYDTNEKTYRFEPLLKSFPFPYYIVLKNIEALPSTLADLLRQWFEVIQLTRS